MNIGISRPTTTIEETRHMLETAATCGFSGVQLKPKQYLLTGLSKQEFQQAYGNQAALVQGGLIFYVGSDIEKWPSAIQPSLDFAAEVEAGHVCVCGGVSRGGEGEAEARQRYAAQVLNEIGQTANAKGLRISLHNHANSLFETVDDLDFMVENLNPEYCGLTLDTAHFAKIGVEDVAALVHRYSKVILNVHLKDMDAQGNFCPLGTGTIELDRVLSALAEINYDEWLIVDEESRDFATEEAFAISRDFLSAKGLMNSI